MDNMIQLASKLQDTIERLEAIKNNLPNGEDMYYGDASFHNSDFLKSDFGSCDFDSCDFKNTSFYDTTMLSCFHRVDFTGSSFSGCDFIDTDLTDVDLRYACLDGVKINASQLDKMVIMPDGE